MDESPYVPVAWGQEEGSLGHPWAGARRRRSCGGASSCRRGRRGRRRRRRQRSRRCPGSPCWTSSTPCTAAPPSPPPMTTRGQMDLRRRCGGESEAVSSRRGGSGWSSCWSWTDRGRPPWLIPSFLYSSVMDSWKTSRWVRHVYSTTTRTTCQFAAVWILFGKFREKESYMHRVLNKVYFQN